MRIRLSLYTYAVARQRAAAGCTRVRKMLQRWERIRIPCRVKVSVRCSPEPLRPGTTTERSMSFIHRLLLKRLGVVATHAVSIRRNIHVRMPDGAGLLTDLYLGNAAAGAPVIL